MVKRLLSELKALAKLEPSTGVVLAEGIYDRNLLRHFVRNEMSDWAVYDCNAIEDDINAGPRHDCRSLLIGFAKNCSNGNISNIVCVIDADLETVVPVERDDTQLLKTDFANMAMYGLNEDFFKAIGISTGVIFSKDEIKSALDLATEIFLLRVVKEGVEEKHSLPSLEKTISFDADRANLNVKEYEKLLSISSRGHLVWKNGIKSAISHLSVPEDRRYTINDHDLCLIISKFLKHKLNKSSLKDDDVLRLLMITAGGQIDTEHPMFVTLKDRITQQSVTTPVAPPPPAPVPGA